LVIDGGKVGHVDLHRFRIKHYPVLMKVDYFPNPKRVKRIVYKKKKKMGKRKLLHLPIQCASYHKLLNLHAKCRRGI
jgi:hypothetical protein